MIPEEALKPLTAEYDDDLRLELVIFEDDFAFSDEERVYQKEVAEIFVFGAQTGNVYEHRAKLFAAAPDLYKALKRIVFDWDAGSFEIVNCKDSFALIESAREALLLAERPIGGAE